eukprot:TRINITY_DN2909_c0_g1_i3.p1 TRINITY_DN2909_c0_g1~~TRINITY_DN2909_c0_g1_i3.p1  ORF type:complete len:215 (+),score=24.52 TRINITY_DN2909_c0_g1_i3:206-850(+)
MGCIVCRHSTDYDDANLRKQTDKANSNEIVTVPFKGSEAHNRVKESSPCHIKLATDHGSTLKAKTIGYKRKELGKAKKFRTMKNPNKGEEEMKSERNSTALSSTREKKFPHFRPIQTHYLRQCDPLDSNIIVTPETADSSVLFDSGCLILEKKGSIYDQYRVVDVVGRGSFGIVKKVVHRTSGKPYALKIIKKSCCQNKNFMNEMEVLKKLVRS